MSFASTSNLCDTLPPLKLALRSTPSPQLDEEISQMIPVVDHHQLKRPELLPDDQLDVRRRLDPIDQMAPPPGRKLCPRHQRMADEGTNLKLQQALDALPEQEREAINAIWSNFSSSPHPRRALILQGLLTMCCFSQLSLVTEQLAHLIRIDPFSVLPRELSLKILAHLDAISLGRAAQVSKTWKTLADDDILWRSICEQHIGQKCLKCGWGLPRLEKKRKILHIPSSSSSHRSSFNESAKKHSRDNDDPPPDPQAKRHKSRQLSSGSYYDRSSSSSQNSSRSTTPLNPLVPPPCIVSPTTVTRPWKDVYCERFAIERNWRRGRCTLRTLQGHKDGVMCLQINETLTHPSFPILITGSYDRTVRVWNLETGAQIRCLEGHTNAVRALQFDDVKLVTGSMDRTIKIWNWRRGVCMRTLEAHTEGVVCLNFDSEVLASGSVDASIKIWNFRNGEHFSLRGHRDWVNSVQLWDSNAGPNSLTRSASPPSQTFDWSPRDCQSNSNPTAPSIDAGKMLFSSSDDSTIRLWDLALRTCVRQFTGHVGQVQSLKLVYLDRQDRDESGIGDRNQSNAEGSIPLHRQPSEHPIQASSSLPYDDSSEPSAQPQPALISGSLDNTIKIWDINTGNAVKTLFGHIEGVWAVAGDKMRLISGSHDRTIKVWNREDGQCTATLVGHRGAVTCVALGEDKIVSGSDDGDIRIWSFGE